MSTIFTLKQEQVNFLLHGSFAAVSKIYHLEAPGILMLLSQKFPCDQTAVCYSENSQNRERWLWLAEFSATVSGSLCRAVINEHSISSPRSEWSYMSLRIQAAHQPSELWWWALTVLYSVHFVCWKSWLVYSVRKRKYAKVVPSATLKCKPFHCIYPLGFPFEAVVSLKVKCLHFLMTCLLAQGQDNLSLTS